MAKSCFFVCGCWFLLGSLAVCSDEGPSERPKSVEPQKIEQEGRYEVRTFVLHPEESFDSVRGGSFKLVAIREKEVVIKRTFDVHWPGAGRYSIGNHEYLEIVSVDREQQAVTFRLNTKTKFYLWEAYSF